MKNNKNEVLFSNAVQLLHNDQNKSTQEFAINELIILQENNSISSTRINKAIKSVKLEDISLVEYIKSGLQIDFGYIISNSNFKNVKFNNVSFIKHTFYKVAFLENNFTNNTLKFTGKNEFVSSDFIGADFCDADLSNCSFTNQSIGGSDPSDSMFQNIDFEGAVFKDCEIINGTIHNPDFFQN